MNIFELLYLVIWISAGLIGGFYGKHMLGLYGFPAGMLVSMIIIYSLYYFCDHVISGRIAKLPPCPIDLSSEYDFVDWLMDSKGEVIGGIYRCLFCGHKYLKRRRHFDMLLDDGSIQPYMFHPAFGNWRIDRQKPK